MFGLILIGSFFVGGTREALINTRRPSSYQSVTSLCAGSFLLVSFAGIRSALLLYGMDLRVSSHLVATANGCSANTPKQRWAN